MKLIKANDQDFGNTYLTTVNGESLAGVRPHISWGCHGLAKINNQWYVFSEDDGHYWSNGVITEEEIKEVAAGLKELDKSIFVRKHFCKFITKNPKIKSNYFEFDFTIGKEKEIESFSLKIRDIKLTMHPYWIKSLLYCFQLKLHDERTS